MVKRNTKRPARRRKTARPRKPTAVAKTGPAAPKRRPRRAVAKADHLTVMEAAELDGLRQQLQRAARAQSPLRWNADPDDVQRSVAQLVLTLVEFIRQLLERQSIRRMEAGTLTDRQVEDVGRALMQLEETVRDIAAKFGIPAEDLNLDLGPLGKLL
jgi:predicted transcriptional regulator